VYIGYIRIKQFDKFIFDEIDILGSRVFDKTSIDRLIYRFDNKRYRRQDSDI